MADMTWAESMKQRVRDWLDTLPDPAFIRVPTAGRTVPFKRGKQDFKVKESGPAIIEYLDEDHGLLAAQNLKQDVVPGDNIHLIVPVGTFWRADMR